MLGLDERLAELSNGSSVTIAILVAVLLGLRHATDPDHIVAVTSLVTGGPDRNARAAARIGFFWGLGHALTLFALGLPIVLFGALVPEPAKRAAEAVVAAVIIVLGVRILARWRRGHFHFHAHAHDGMRHNHLHPHAVDGQSVHLHAHADRSPLGSFLLGLIHGVGGSAGAGLLVLATAESMMIAAISLVLLALFTGVSMTILSGGFGLALSRRRVRAVFGKLAPVLGLASLAFGLWYGLAAVGFAPYSF